MNSEVCARLQRLSFPIFTVLDRRYIRWYPDLFTVLKLYGLLQLYPALENYQVGDPIPSGLTQVQRALLKRAVDDYGGVNNVPGVEIHSPGLHNELPIPAARTAT